MVGSRLDWTGFISQYNCSNSSSNIAFQFRHRAPDVQFMKLQESALGAPMSEMILDRFLLQYIDPNCMLCVTNYIDRVDKAPRYVLDSVRVFDHVEVL